MLLKGFGRTNRAITRSFSSSQPVVAIPYDELLSASTETLSTRIDAAYNHQGLGLLLVTSLPILEMRARLLRLSQSLARLSDAEKGALETPEYHYSIGWSHGKERFMGEPDWSKGSFYANPIQDYLESSTKDAAGKFIRMENLWPKKTLPDLAPAYQEVGRFVRSVGLLLSRHLDSFVKSKNPNY